MTAIETAPTTETLPQTAMAMLRSRSTGKAIRISARVAGIIAAAPTASSAREAMRIQAVGENAATSEARPKTTSPTTNMRTWPIRSPSVPLPSSRPAMTTG